MEHSIDGAVGYATQEKFLKLYLIVFLGLYGPYILESLQSLLVSPSIDQIVSVLFYDLLVGAVGTVVAFIGFVAILCLVLAETVENETNGNQSRW